MTLLTSGMVLGQTCAPAPLLPISQISGQLDGTSCSLSDATPYASYQLVYPVRGSMQASAANPSANPVNVSLSLILRNSAGSQVASGVSISTPVESGVYTLLINAAGSIPYTLQTAFTAEPGMLCANFPLLGLNQTVSGNLGTAGCQLPDTTPYDGYSVQTLGSGTLTISVSTTAFTPTLTVRDSTGVPLALGGAALSVNLAAASTFEILVSTGDTTGPYQVTTSFQAAPTETCVAAGSLTQPGATSGAITSTSCTVVIDSEGDLAYFSYYNLTVAGQGVVDLAAASGDFTPSLYLLDSAGNLLTQDTGGGANGGAEIRMQVNPGTYLVEIFSNFASGGNYSLNYGFTPGTPQPCTPAVMNPGDSPSGSLSAQSCRTTLGLADLYSVTLPAAGTLNLDVITTAFSGQVALRDTKDNLVVLNQDIEGLGDSHISAVLPAGSYTVAASAISGSGAYQLTSSFSPSSIPVCPPAQSLGINSGYVQILGASGCIGSNGQPLDAYQFTLPAPGVVAAVMTSSEFAGDLTLTDSAGNPLRHDQSSYAPNDPLIAQSLQAGTYQLLARAASASAAGLYEVTLITTIGPRPPFCTPLGSQPLGSTVQGTLGTTSCQWIDGTFADIYPLTLAGASSVDLRLNSDAFDAYLLLLDAKGNLLAQDDDSGGGTNSRIQQALPAGTYFVVAKPFANYYSVGAYTLLLIQAQSQ